MTDASFAQIPVTANFINPEAIHRPTGYTHVVEVTAGRPVYIAGQVALDPRAARPGPGYAGGWWRSSPSGPPVTRRPELV
jgi:hypothetical protein